MFGWFKKNPKKSECVIVCTSDGSSYEGERYCRNWRDVTWDWVCMGCGHVHDTTAIKKTMEAKADYARHLLAEARARDVPTTPTLFITIDGKSSEIEFKTLDECNKIARELRWRRRLRSSKRG